MNSLHLPLFRPAPKQPRKRSTGTHPPARTAVTIGAAPPALATVLFLILALEAAALGAPRGAEAKTEQESPSPPLTIETRVEGSGVELPLLVEGEDFTRGEPFGSDPRYLVDDTGAMPLSSFVEGKEAEGLKLVWRDQDGNTFDWVTTPVTRSLIISASFEPADYEVRVSFEDGRDDIVVNVAKGSSFQGSYGSIPAAPEKKGFVFETWIDASTGEAFDFAAPISSSTTIYASYRLDSPEETVTIDPVVDIPERLTGSCYIGKTWGVHPARFNVSGFTGGLKGCSGTGVCSLPSAAAPSYTRATYVAKLARVDTAKGEVVYDVAITPPDAASPDGPRNQYGLIGYQTVSFTAVVKVSFGGHIELAKTSSNPGLSEGLSTYTLQGAVFGIYNAKGSRVGALTTDETGAAGPSDLLPAGTYTIKEEKAPSGYAPGIDREVRVEAGKTKRITLENAPQSSLIEAALKKIDAETGQPAPLGAATLSGAEFRIDYYDFMFPEPNSLSTRAPLERATTRDRAVDPDEIESWGEPKRSWTFRTDENGGFSFSEEYLVEGDEFYRDGSGKIALPLGVVVITETKAPEGYLLNEEPIVREITPVGIEEHVEAFAERAFNEQVLRGDFSFTKVAGDTMERLANVPFLITSQTTGEAHTLVTDENGMASTASSWTPHSQNTNAGTSSSDGIWFGQDANGALAPVDDGLGALPYDTYRVEEQRCATNENLELVSFTVRITRDSTTLDLGTIDDEPPFIEIEGDVDKRETLIDSNGNFSYTIDYRSTSTTWADEFNMIDEVACVADGSARIVSLTTPVCFGDYDGKMNVWYRTNLTDEERSDHDRANACSTNPRNDKNPNNERVHDYTGWRLWREGVSTLESSELSAEELELAEGEYPIALAFEHGRVEEGFGTNIIAADDWQRRDRYEEIDLIEKPIAHDATFTVPATADHTDDTGLSEPAGEKEIVYAPAFVFLQATPEAMENGVDELWNDASIDIHRDLELHHEDKDSVKQSIEPHKTIIEKITSSLPRTDDPLVAVAAPLAAATALAIGIIASEFPTSLLRRRRLRIAVRNGGL